MLDHARHPRNRGGLELAEIVRRGRNPQCGDEIEVGIAVARQARGEVLASARFRGRGCAVCIASASIATDALCAMTRADAVRLTREMTRWFGAGGAAPSGISPALQALALVRDYPARLRCALLAWQALSEALDPDAVKPSTPG